MIFYNPADGDALTTSIPAAPRHCFLMTRLGTQIPPLVDEIRTDICSCCENIEYEVIDAASRVTGRDFLVKIWKLIASSPLSVGVVHEDIPQKSQANIYYELGVAQAMGKETVIVKSPRSAVPSDFVRSEYIVFDDQFRSNFSQYLDGLPAQADHYELIADQLDRNPILALDYLKRAYLITGDQQLRDKAKAVSASAAIQDRATNSVELLAGDF